MAPRRQNPQQQGTDPRNYQFPGLENPMQRRFNNDIDRMAMDNEAAFRNAAGRVQAQVADIAARKANGEEVEDPLPGATPQMVADITREYEATTKQITRDIKSQYVTTPNGAPPDPRWVQVKINELNSEHTLELRKRVHDKYGPAGDNVLKAITNETQDKGPLGTMLSKISTTGGLIGGLIAGFAAFSAMGGLGGGVMAMVGGLVGVMAGGVLGGSINEWVAGSGRKHPPLVDHSQPLNQAQGQSQQQTIAQNGPGQNQQLETGNLTPTGIPNRTPNGAEVQIS